MRKFCPEGIVLIALTAAIAIGALGTAVGIAARPGGGGTTPPPRYSIVELPLLNLRAFDVTNPDTAGFVTVIGEVNEAGYASAAVARVRVSDKSVTGILLPEPTDGKSPDLYSEPNDINVHSTVVGSAAKYDEDPNDSVGVPILWMPVPGEFAYTHKPLLLLPGGVAGSAMGINDDGWMVGVSTSDPNAPGTAVLWSPDGDAIYDLQEALPAESGWDLISAKKINNDLQVIGLGFFQDVQTGFLLQAYFVTDPQTQALTLVAVIEPIPLAAGATSCEPEEINEKGEVVGVMNYSTRPSRLPFFYDGEKVVLLPSLTDSYALAGDLNENGTLVGWTSAPNLENGNGALGTLWEPTTSGGFTVTDLNTQVPTKPEWYLKLTFGLNDYGWIAGYGRKFDKGKYTWTGLLLVPN